MEAGLEMEESSKMVEEGDFNRCPYNSSHFVTAKRMTIHVEKCRKLYLEEMKRRKDLVEMVCCKHNRTHHFPRIELSYHEVRCHDQYGSYDPYHQYFVADPISKYLSDLSSNARPTPLPPYIPPPFLNASTTIKEFDRKCIPEEEPSYEDDWTLVPGGAVYDPQKKLDDELVLYLPRGLSKSEREKYVKKNIEKAKTIKNFRGLPSKIEKEKNGESMDMVMVDSASEIRGFRCNNNSESDVSDCDKVQYVETEAETETENEND